MDEGTPDYDAVRFTTAEQRSAFWQDIRQSLGESDTPPSVVYYLRFGDRVKIGYTTNLAVRLRAIPYDEVLATEPGAHHEEKVRHAMFAPLRIKGEWFRYEEPLVSHIANLM